MTDKGWKTIIKSVRGASHLRSGLPNQDAIKFISETGMGIPVILAVSDGHGSLSYFRSDTGSRLAVEAACEVGTQFLKDYEGKESVEDIKFKDVICREIVKCWLNKVKLDIKDRPFTPEEEIIREKTGDPLKRTEIQRFRPSASEGISENLILPYGSTVITIIVTWKYILYLQLGDGDILTVTAEGDVHRPISRDVRLIANETTSLCLPIAWDEFKFHYQPIEHSQPALILVSSDGYANSYTDNKSFEKVGTDILTMIQSEKDGVEKGIERISDNLDAWLTETSDKGSGDDISVGIICNLGEIQKVSESGRKVREMNLEEISDENSAIEENPDKSTLISQNIEMNLVHDNQ
jgi:hypothetical protein